MATYGLIASLIRTLVARSPPWSLTCIIVFAADRAADSLINVVNPIMAYFPLIVVFATRYDKRCGSGTVITLMPPYFIADDLRLDPNSWSSGT